MDRPRLIRGLRIAWSVWWGIFCVLLIVLWVRSYSTVDMVKLWQTSPKQFAYVHSVAGQVWFDMVERRAFEPRFRSYPVNAKYAEVCQTFRQCMNHLGFGTITSGALSVTFVSYWRPLLASVSITAVPWIHTTMQFSLRTLLLATTLAAMVLGFVG